MPDRTFEILLIEDNPAFVRITREALKRSTLGSKTNVARDGVEAMDFLRNGPGFESMKKPDLIFLDLNMPRKDGREVLAEIKADEALRRIPVVVLTTSSAEEDIIDCYNLYAHWYIVKPSELDEFFDAILGCERFWRKTATAAPV
jgi:chemotaxis family two-component system response regulator Rcp1